MHKSEIGICLCRKKGKFALAAGGGGGMHQLDQAAEPLSPHSGEFSARSGRKASKSPFDAARKYDEVDIPVEKKKTPKNNVSWPLPILVWLHFLCIET